MQEGQFIEIGNRLKKIRAALKRTADSYRQDSGISRSYISDFERGFKLPTTKFLKYLVDVHHVSLDYIFTGRGDWRIEENEDRELYSYFKETPLVKEMIEMMQNVPHAYFAIMTAFAEYKINHQKLVDTYLASTTGDKS